MNDPPVYTRDQIEAYREAKIITDRQAEILQLRRRGFSQYTLAFALGITRSTVRSLERTATDKIKAASLRKDAA